MSTYVEGLQAALADRYAIERELGRGGMATVYLAQDLKHPRQVALKVLRPELAAALGPYRFLQEIRVTSRLQHPHILSLLDSGTAGDLLYYVMPYVEGESLRQRLDRETHLQVDAAVAIAREVADALDYAHTQGVIHRDIKPENILMLGSHALVADFGIAKALSIAGGEKLTETGLALGTPAYMSPEQAAGDSQLDGRSDLYSLGCVLYEMLVGHPPFLGRSAQEILARQVLDPPPPPRTVRPTVPAALERTLLQALAKAPADRFATAHQFAEALDLSMSGPEVALYLLSAGSHLNRHGQRSPGDPNSRLGRAVDLLSCGTPGKRSRRDSSAATRLSASSAEAVWPWCTWPRTSSTTARSP